MRHLLTSALIVAAGAGAAQAAGWELDGFRAPESAFYEAGMNRIVVSNIGAFGPDGGQDGALSLVSPEGELINADWVTGLTDPKGMAAAEGKLYVADADGLHVIDIATATPETVIALTGAQMPNDVTVGTDGAIYVTDMMAGALYRVVDGAAQLFVPAGTLDLPNGIWAEADRLVVGSMGTRWGADGIEGAGALIAVGYDGSIGGALPGAGETGAIDGVVEAGGRLVFTDNPTGEIVAYDGSALEVIATTGPGAADLGVMNDTLLVPVMREGRLVALPAN